MLNKLIRMLRNAFGKNASHSSTRLESVGYGVENLVRLQMFQPIRRAEKIKRGGVCINYHEHLTPKLVNDHSLLVDQAHDIIEALKDIAFKHSSSDGSINISSNSIEYETAIELLHAFRTDLSNHFHDETLYFYKFFDTGTEIKSQRAEEIRGFVRECFEEMNMIGRDIKDFIRRYDDDIEGCRLNESNIDDCIEGFEGVYNDLAKRIELEHTKLYPLYKEYNKIINKTENTHQETVNA